MKKINLIFLSVIACLSAITTANAAAGDLDPTFGPVGFVTTSLGSGADRAYAAARQTDGKIILAGTRANGSVALVRYNPNGTLDTSFDADGIVITSPGGLSEASAVAVQPDGKIVVAGTSGASGGPYLLIRYNPNGSLDTTFDGDGIFADNTVGIPKALIIQPDGKIVTAGSRSVNFFSSDFSVVRHNPDGSFDTTFDGDGKVSTSIGDAAAGGENFAYAVALQPDGKILVAGESNFLNTARDFSLVRYNADGSLDTTFDGDGKVQTAFGGNGQLEAARAIAVQTDGRIVLAGLGGEGGARGFALARYNADGSLDQTFGGDGRVVTSNAGGNEGANAVVVQPDGKIIAAGYIGLQIGLIRYNTDGSLDTAFSGDGKVSTIVYERGSAVARAILIEPNGKIDVAGSASVGGSADEDFVLARYNADGTPSTELGTFGRVTTNLFGTSSEATDVVVQPDGKIIVAGNRAATATLTIGVIVRYTADGRIDTTFANSSSDSGSLSVYIGGASDHELNHIALQPDGKILAVGTYGGESDAGLFVARFNADGSRDTAFGGNNSGYAIVSITNGGGLGQDIALQPDGKIVVVGAAVNADQTADFAVYRFNADGSRDTTFGAGGASVLSLSAGNDIAYSAAVQTDGKIVVAGARNLAEGANGDIALVRFNPNGSLDAAFGANGTVISALGNFADIATEIQLQTDGKIVASAVSCVDAACNTGKAALLRYNSNGLLDLSFDADGLVFVQIAGSTSAAAASLAIQRDGRIVVAGESVSPLTQSDAFVARYNADGSPDSSFGANGVVTSDVNNSQQTASAVALQADGKIVAAGSSLTGTRPDFTVWRYLGDAVTTVPRPTRFDFDGDGKADVSVYRPASGTWYLLNSQAGFSLAQFGISSDKIVPADYDGDGKTDIAVFRDGNWYLQRSARGFAAIQFGSQGDIPAPADFDGDGKSELVVFRPSSGYWYVLNLANNQFTAVQFGLVGDKPVAADYDGDGKADFAVFRPSSGIWYVLQSANGFASMQFGISTDKPVVGDYDGDGKADFAVYRPSSGVWYVLQTAKGFTSTQFGISTDSPAPADYDGDGKTDIAVFRPESGSWYQMQSTRGFGTVQFGASGDRPAPNAFVP